MRTAGKALIIFLGFSMAWGDAGASSTRAAVKVPRSARLCDESVNFVSAAVHRPLRSPTMPIGRDEAHIVMGRLRGGEGGEGERGGMVIGAVGKVVVHDADSTSITVRPPFPHHISSSRVVVGPLHPPAGVTLDNVTGGDTNQKKQQPPSTSPSCRHDNHHLNTEHSFAT
jgi:hypothetical protein